MSEKLLFRRQFLMTNRHNKLKSWKETNLFDDYKLYTHPDLNIVDISLDAGEKRAVLLGFLIDPNHISYTDYDILKDMLEKSNNFEDFQKNSISLSGRWILIFLTDDEKKIFNDPATSRHIYYSTGDELMLASNSNTINYYINHPKNSDPEYQEYISSKFYNINEGEWYSDATGYENIYKLLPNHYYDLENKKSQKFWIDIDYINYNQTIDRSIEILVNSFKAIDKRDYYKILALTSGFDSRVIYAASSYADIDCKYFLSTMNILKSEHPDLVIAEKILNDDNKELIILDDLEELTDDFLYYYKENIEKTQILPKSLTAQHLLLSPNIPNNTLYITGNNSAVFKDYYRKREASSGKEISKLSGIPKKYTIFDNSFDKWIRENKYLIKKSQINMMDLFYWEHRLANFGVKYVANQDIAVDEFAAFNNRELFLLLMKAKYENKIDHNEIFKDIINQLDPKLMNYPINPSIGKNKIANFVKKNVSKRTWENIKLVLKK